LRQYFPAPRERDACARARTPHDDCFMQVAREWNGICYFQEFHEQRRQLCQANMIAIGMRKDDFTSGSRGGQHWRDDDDDGRENFGRGQQAPRDDRGRFMSEGREPRLLRWTPVGEYGGSGFGRGDSWSRWF
jgi:hypothetical protein